MRGSITSKVDGMLHQRHPRFFGPFDVFRRLIQNSQFDQNPRYEQDSFVHEYSYKHTEFQCSNKIPQFPDKNEIPSIFALLCPGLHFGIPDTNKIPLYMEYSYNRTEFQCSNKIPQFPDTNEIPIFSHIVCHGSKEVAHTGTVHLPMACSCS
jgi:hypothetical protein